MKHIVIVDTLGWLYRQYYKAYSIINDKGNEVGLVNRFFMNLNQLISELEPDYIILAMDNKGSTFRNEEDSGYKDNRASMPKDLSKQLATIESVLKDNSLELTRVVKQEADDVIASICNTYKNKYVITIVGYDKDFNQLLSKGSVRIYDPSYKQFKTYNSFITKYGFNPNRFNHYQALVGDNSDSVKGVKGVGDKTAQKLISEYKTISKLYNKINNISGALHTKLVQGKSSAYKSLRLVTLTNNLKPINKLFDYRSAKYERIKFKLMEL